MIEVKNYFGFYFKANRMRYFKLFFFATILFSCKENNSGNKFDHQLNYFIDTVKIDLNDRLLDLKYGINMSDLDAEKNSIYLYNSFDHSIDEIDLDSLKVANNYPLEKEGPNGTGEYIYNIQLFNDSLFYIKTFAESGVFNKKGNLIQKIDWEKSKDSSQLDLGGFIKFELASFKNKEIIFGLNIDQINQNVFLDELSISENTVRRFEIDSEKSYQNFVVTVDDPLDYTYWDPLVYLGFENNLLIVTHQFSNEIFLFHSDGGHFKTVHYQPNLTPGRSKDLSGKKITSYDQAKEEYQKFYEQVTFGPVVWDGTKNRYFRFSSSRVFSETFSDKTILPDVKDVKVFLTVFDADFNLISEMPLPESAIKLKNN